MGQKVAQDSDQEGFKAVAHNILFNVLTVSMYYFHELLGQVKVNLDYPSETVLSRNRVKVSHFFGHGC